MPVASAPSAPPGLVTPPPVANTCTTLPTAAGLDAELRLLSWFRIAPGPEPVEFCAKIAGAVCAPRNVERHDHAALVDKRVDDRRGHTIEEYLHAADRVLQDSA